MRPSELIDVSDDPYVAYCFDSACAFILEHINRNHYPIFPGSKKDEANEPKRTTNSAIIAEMQRANKRK